MDLPVDQPKVSRWLVGSDPVNDKENGLLTWPQSDGTIKSLVVLQYWIRLERIQVSRNLHRNNYCSDDR